MERDDVFMERDLVQIQAQMKNIFRHWERNCDSIKSLWPLLKHWLCFDIDLINFLIMATTEEKMS